MNFHCSPANSLHPLLLLVAMHFYKSFFGLVTVALSGVAALATPEIQTRDAWSDQVVQLHNSYRAQYGAPPVTWNQGLYPATLQYAQQCNFAHSGGSGYGENLAAGYGNGYSFETAMANWMAEASQYDYNNPGFSSATGHFTQVVWKATTGVACAVATCPAGTIFGSQSSYYICRYTPPGNYLGQFAQNVGRHV